MPKRDGAGWRHNAGRLGITQLIDEPGLGADFGLRSPSLD